MFYELLQNAVMERRAQDWKFVNLQSITNLDSSSVQEVVSREAQLLLFWKNKTTKLLFKNHYFYVGSELSLNSSHLKPINPNAGDFSCNNGYFMKTVKQNFICCQCVFFHCTLGKDV